MDKQFEKEKQRKLSPVEEKRLERFDALCAELEGQGYARNDLTIGIVRANVFAVVFAIPVFIIGIAAFILANPGGSFSMGLSDLLIAIGAMLVLTVVHELVHGITWSRFSENGWNDIDFGFMKEYMTPYCTCKAPLPKGSYITGALMPGLLLGVVPMAIGVIMGSYLVLFIGIIMTVSAAGDVMIVFSLLRHRSSAAEKLIFDHPTQAGCVVFER